VFLPSVGGMGITNVQHTKACILDWRISELQRADMTDVDLCALQY
jgi:hypothetical protein